MRKLLKPSVSQCPHPQSRANEAWLLLRLLKISRWKRQRLSETASSPAYCEITPGGKGAAGGSHLSLEENGRSLHKHRPVVFENWSWCQGVSGVLGSTACRGVQPCHFGRRSWCHCCQSLCPHEWDSHGSRMFRVSSAAPDPTSGSLGLRRKSSSWTRVFLPGVTASFPFSSSFPSFSSKWNKFASALSGEANFHRQGQFLTFLFHLSSP